jgi:hypothetical protein
MMPNHGPRRILPVVAWSPPAEAPGTSVLQSLTVGSVENWLNNWLEQLAEATGRCPSASLLFPKVVQTSGFSCERGGVRGSPERGDTLDSKDGSALDGSFPVPLLCAGRHERYALSPGASAEARWKAYQERRLDDHELRGWFARLTRLSTRGLGETTHPAAWQEATLAEASSQLRQSRRPGVHHAFQEMEAHHIS